jgi:flavin-dependent dehydrogenase
MTTHDAIIIGAGPAGAVTAILLARAGWSVALVEKSVFPRRKVCGEFLSATNRPLFAELGIASAFDRLAGPEIRRMALFAGGAAIAAPMPRPAAPAQYWGRALGRDVLDTLLTREAEASGAQVFQPYSARLGPPAGGSRAVTISHGGESRTLAAPIVIEAHGAWGASAGRLAPEPGDLLGFKAHFRGATLDPDLMPLLVFPGGYGGLVTTNDALVCFGCCIRRDTLAAAHGAHDGPPALAVLEHVRRHCRATATVLDGAVVQGSWLGAGPIRPGLRSVRDDGTLRVGNAAGEAHSLVGEGMSMAMQAAWLLAHTLIGTPQARQGRGLDQAAETYRRAWRAAFVPRITAAGLFARLAMSRGPVRALLPLFSAFPGLLTYAAARSGKTRLVVS